LQIVHNKSYHLITGCLQHDITSHTIPLKHIMITSCLQHVAMSTRSMCINNPYTHNDR